MIARPGQNIYLQLGPGHDHRQQQRMHDTTFSTADLVPPQEILPIFLREHAHKD